MTGAGIGRSRALPQSASVLWLALTLGGCATYYDHLQRAGAAASAGNYTAAVEDVNAVLGVRSDDQLPERWGSDTALATLERGVLHQSLDRFSDSSRDLSAAEQQLELLDMSVDAIGTLGQYIYSDSARNYRTPPSERLSLNAVNLLNYLAAGDLEGAAVEARRFQVMREYLDSVQVSVPRPARLGQYLAGFVFERRGEGDRALRYYEEVLAQGPSPSLVAPVTSLARSNPYRSPNLDAILAGADSAPPARSGGEILVVLGMGRVSHKEARRVPIGAAVGIAGSLLSGNVDWLRYGAGTVVVYPELVETPSTLRDPTVTIDGEAVDLEDLANLDAAVREEYEQLKPKIMVAALTRMASRGAVAEGVRAAGSQQSQLLGDVLSILTEGLLVTLDKPDTRSWTMLPARFLAARVSVSPGSHSVAVGFSGVSQTRSATVNVPASGQTTVVITEPR